jgi:chromosome segregation ATPase
VEIVKFKELEEKIKSILKEYSLLKKHSKELEERLKNKGLELEEARNRLKELNEERDAIRTKVDSLLGLLQDVSVDV